MTDSSGNVIGEQGHYPFGESWYQNSTTTKWLFTSYERDAESGNDYASFRYDVNRLGRFASPDLLAGSVADPQSLDRYAYALNDPVNLVDPLGLDCCLVMGADGRCEVDLDGGGGDAEGGGGGGGGGGDGGGLIPFYNPGYCPPQFESCTSGPEGGYGGSYALYCYFITVPGVEGGTQQVPYCAQTIALAASPYGPTDLGHGGGAGEPTDKNGKPCKQKILDRVNARFGTNFTAADVVPFTDRPGSPLVPLVGGTANIEIAVPAGTLPPDAVSTGRFGGGSFGVGSTLHVVSFAAVTTPSGAVLDEIQAHLDEGNPTVFPFLPGAVSHLGYVLGHAAGPCP